MKLIGRNTQAELDRARAELPTLATAIATLGRQREAALAGDSDDAVAAIDREAEEQGKRLRRLHDRIALLEHKLIDEQAEQARKDYQVAVAAIAGPVARRNETAVALEKALADVGVAAKRFALATENVLKAWPENVPFPPRAYPGHCLSLGRMGQLVESVFVGFEIVNPRTRLRVQAIEFATRAMDAAERVRLSAFAATERQLGDEWLTDLKTANEPISPSGENAENEKIEAVA